MQTMQMKYEAWFSTKKKKKQKKKKYKKKKNTRIFVCYKFVWNRLIYEFLDIFNKYM